MDARNKDKRPNYDNMLTYDQIMEFLEKRYPKKCFNLDGECPFRDAYNDTTDSLSVEIVKESNGNILTLDELNEIKVIDEETGQKISLISLLESNDAYEFVYTKTEESTTKTTIVNKTDHDIYAKEPSDLYITTPSDFKYSIYESSERNDESGIIIRKQYIELNEYIGNEPDIYIPTTMALNGSMRSVIIKPSSITYIENKNSFFNTTRLLLRNIYIDDGVHFDIGAGAFFANCYNLEYAKLPDETMNLNYTFYNCNSLKSLDCNLSSGNFENIFNDKCPINYLGNLVLPYGNTNGFPVVPPSVKDFISFDDEYTGYVSIKGIENAKCLTDFTLPKTDCISNYSGIFKNSDIDYVFGFIDNVATDISEMMSGAKNVNGELTICAKSISNISDAFKDTSSEDGNCLLLKGNSDLTKSLAESSNGNVYFETPLSDFEYTIDHDNRTITLTKYIGNDSIVYVKDQYTIDGYIYNTIVYSGEVYNLPDPITETDNIVSTIPVSTWIEGSEITTSVDADITIEGSVGENSVSNIKFYNSDNEELIFDKLDYPENIEIEFTLLSSNWKLNSESNLYESIVTIPNHDNLTYDIEYLGANSDFDIDAISSIDLEETSIIARTTSEDIMNEDIPLKIKFDVGRSSDISTFTLKSSNWSIDEFTGVLIGTATFDKSIDIEKEYNLVYDGDNSDISNAMKYLSIYNLDSNTISFTIETSNSDVQALFTKNDISFSYVENYIDYGYIYSYEYNSETKTIDLKSFRKPDKPIIIKFDVSAQIPPEIPNTVINIDDDIYIYPGVFSNNTSIKRVWFEDGISFKDGIMTALFINCNSLVNEMNIGEDISNLDYAFYKTNVHSFYLDISDSLESSVNWFAPYDESIKADIVISNLPDNAKSMIYDDNDNLLSYFTKSVIALGNYSFNIKSDDHFTYIYLTYLNNTPSSIIVLPYYYYYNGKRCKIMIANAYNAINQALYAGKVSTIKGNGPFVNNQYIQRVSSKGKVFVEDDDMSMMFMMSANLQEVSLKVPHYIRNMTYTFYKTKLTSLDIPDQYCLKSIAGAFKNCTGSLDLANFNLPYSIESMYETFRDSSVWEFQPVPVNVKDISYMCNGSSIEFDMTNENGMIAEYPLYKLRNYQNAFNVFYTSIGIALGSRLFVPSDYSTEDESTEKDSMHISLDGITYDSDNDVYRVSLDNCGFKENEDYSIEYTIKSETDDDGNIIETKIPIYSLNYLPKSYSTISVDIDDYETKTTTLSSSSETDATKKAFEEHRYIFTKITNVEFDSSTGEFLFSASLRVISTEDTECVDYMVSTWNFETVGTPSSYYFYLFDSSLGKDIISTFYSNTTNLPNDLVYCLDDTGLGTMNIDTSEEFEREPEALSSLYRDEVYDSELNKHIEYDVYTETVSVDEKGNLDIITDENRDLYFNEDGTPKPYKCPRWFCPSHIYQLYSAYWYAYYHENSRNINVIESSIRGYIEQTFYLFDAETGESLNVNEINILDLLTSASIRTVQKTEDGGVIFKTTEQNAELISSSLKDSKYDIIIHV